MLQRVIDTDNIPFQEALTNKAHTSIEELPLHTIVA
jgi:hypothetical protein